MGQCRCARLSIGSVDARWIYYTVDREAAAHWQAWFSEFMDPVRIICGPEGQQLLAKFREARLLLEDLSS